MFKRLVLISGLESCAREIAGVLQVAIDQNLGRGKKYGFALMLFAFQGPEFTWISNADRKTMQEFIAANPPDLTWDAQHG